MRRLAAAYGIRSVFLATPSFDVLRETANYPELRWLSLNGTAAQDVLHSHRFVRLEDSLVARKLDAVREWQRLMLDVYLMAESQALVGAFSSNTVRLAYSLMSAGAGGHLKPFVSLDVNWCFAFFRGGPHVLRRGDAPLSVGDSLANMTC